MHLDEINDVVSLVSGRLHFQIFRHVAQSCQLHAVLPCLLSASVLCKGYRLVLMLDVC